MAGRKPLTLDAVARRIHEISTLPHMAVRVMEVARNPDSGARELKEVVESDVALGARVLRCVNSSAYATRSEITNLQQAIAYLGMRQVRNLAVTASVSRLFKQKETIGDYRREGLWRHLVAVGICGRMLAMRRDFQDFEDVFLAGLMHDIGIIFEDEHLHDEFVDVIQSLPEMESLSQAERQRLGFDHTILAEKVTKSWGFPETVSATVRYHHDSTRYKGEHLRVVQCVEVADMICELQQITSVGTRFVRLPKAAVEDLSLGKEDIVVLAQDLGRELELNQDLLQM
jgi:HD-like signal output (HDOD) protein